MSEIIKVPCDLPLRFIKNQFQREILDALKSYGIRSELHNGLRWMFQDLLEQCQTDDEMNDIILRFTGITLMDWIGSLS